MSERDEIVETIHRLFIATDDRDWAGVREVLSPKVHFDMTSLVGGSPETRTPVEIADGWKTGLAAIDHVHHQAGNFLVDITGDEATAFCYAVAYHHTAAMLRRFVGSYDFHLVRTDRWRIDVFKFNVKFVDPPLT
ncbi:MAG TPA: nuclear transport factor 2 family protein [Kofleriaceae bacterium]|nr:nuclear transport factor 2 family protein [Kofleriaceae bacterium]